MNRRLDLVAPRASRAQLVAVLAALVLATLLPNEPSWPGRSELSRAAVVSPVLSPAAAMAPPGADDARVRAQAFCVGSSQNSAGALGDVVLYRYRRHGDFLDVGYFVYWSTERPWGDNELTRQVFPALAIDAVYSHLLFVLPGMQRVLYGPGDVEGVLVRYRIDGERLVAERALADDALHRPVSLTARDVLAPDGRVVLLTETWSHQLGAVDAVRRSETVPVVCYRGGELRPMSKPIAQAFRLGDEQEPRRARPAWRTGFD